jgi:type III restriction enzyme
MKLLLPAYQIPTTRRPSQAAFVPNIRKAADGWRDQGYEGASDTTKRLLNFWFAEDHQTADRREFSYYFCQREATETLIYLYEVLKAHRFYDLMERFKGGPMLYDPATDRYARYVFKMATGSGKTKVMALAIVWSYFHSLFEVGSDLPKTFLLIAPNVIVYERLRQDFEDGRIFHRDPLIPPEWKADWQFTVILRDDPTPSSTRGTLYLTNVQRLYERGEEGSDNPVEALLGLRPKGSVQLTPQELFDRVVSHGELMLLNDEAHHLHVDDLVWNQRIVAMHEALQARGAAGLAAQLDFTATPKTQQGRLFPEVVVDYPVAQAIEDGIVKRPILGEIGGDIEITDPSASVKWRQRIDAGVAKWKELADELQKSGRKPVLFIMTEDTKDADDIARDLEARYPDIFGGRVLNIHTNRKGEVAETKSNLEFIDQLRKAAREVDSDDNPFRAIVSVLMLREGWDVRNVVVIVPLRPYTAKANILPEQTLGRGLRRMSLPHSGWEERVIVVEHEAFRDFWDKELKEEGLEIERRRLEEVTKDVVTIYVDQSKLQYDLKIPQLSPALTRSAAKLSDLSLDMLPAGVVNAPQPGRVAQERLHYVGRDMLTKEVVEEQDLLIPFPSRPDGLVAYFADRILHYANLRRAGRFAEVAPIVDRYLRDRFFTKPVDLAEPAVIKRLSEPDARQLIISAFVDAINRLSIEPLAVRVERPPLRVSSTPAFPWSRQTYDGLKTVFNLVPCDSTYEAEFAAFLDHAEDVVAYAKNAEYLHFFIEYIASTGGVRYYYPDFVVRAADGDMFLVETKGLEDIEVPIKDDRARKWCRDATDLTGGSWYYVKVPYGIFQSSTAATFDGLYRHAMAAST